MREHDVQRRRVDRSGKANPKCAALDLDHPSPGCSHDTRLCRRGRLRLRWPELRRHSCVLDAQRHEHSGAIGRFAQRRASPGLQQAPRHSAPTCQRRDIDPAHQALRHQRRLLRGCPPAPPGDARDQLDPPILAAFVPVLMHGIIASTIHPATRKHSPHPKHCTRPYPRRGWLTGAPWGWRVRSCVAAEHPPARAPVVTARFACRSTARVRPAARQVPGDTDGPQGEAPVLASQSACQ